MGLKFRCERDLLAKALADAGRAVTTRGGALPVLAGVRLELTGDQLVVTGSDLDLTISVTIEVAGSDDGVAVLPSKLASDVVRSLRSRDGARHIDPLVLGSAIAVFFTVQEALEFTIAGSPAITLLTSPLFLTGVALAPVVGWLLSRLVNGLADFASPPRRTWTSR